MIKTDPRASATRALIVPGWVKALLYGVCGLPVLVVILAIWTQSQADEGNALVAAAIGALVTVAFGWLFGRIYSLCSIVLTPEGITQSFLLRQGRLLTRITRSWEQIESVAFTGRSYRLAAADGSIFQRHLALFGINDKAIKAVRDPLPTKLIDCLDQSV